MAATEGPMSTIPAPPARAAAPGGGVVAFSSCLAQAKSPGEDGVLVPPAAVAAHGAQQSYVAPATAPIPQLFAVVDGHGGAEVTQRVLATLPALVSVELASPATSGAQALAHAIADTEEALLADDTLREQGACAVALLVDDRVTPAQAVVASVGDCVAVAAVGFEGGLQPRRLSGAPHNLSVATELYKTLDAGFDVELDEEDPSDPALFCKSPFLGKDEGGLQCTRSLGDSGFKRPAMGARNKRKSGAGRAPLSAQPNEACVSLGSDDGIAFVVLTTDGVGDHLADGELVSVVQAHLAAGGAQADAAAALVRAATQRAAFAARRSTDELAAMPCGEDRRDVCDDMAVVVVFFR